MVNQERGWKVLRSFLLAGVISLFLGLGGARADTLSQVAAAIGAGAFYDLGYTGTRALIGNVEAGHVWTGHQALDDGRVQYQIHWTGVNGTTFTVHSHATQVGGVMVAENNATTGPGIAAGATLWSGQIATSFGSGGSFSISGNSLLYPLMVFGEEGINSQGVVKGPGARTVDVINSSWGGADNTGNTIINVIYDYLANACGVTMVAAAGNAGQGAGTVGAPANGWNVIAVGAVGPNETVTTWSSGGPTGSFNLPGTRTKPDIVAPGVSITMPTTGGSANYATSSGTSFASPVVSGAAALLIDVGKDTGRSTDPRLVKAVLMNSAKKLNGWTQEVATHPNTSTVINYTPLDSAQGAGMVNLTAALDQYLASTGTGAGAGTVGIVGWDVNTVGLGDPRDYLINTTLFAGDTVTATLVWFMDRRVEGYDSSSANPFASTSFYNDSFDDLDLLLYLADSDGNPVGDPVAASISGWDVNNPDAPGTGLDSVEHLYFTLPQDGRYILRVLWRQELFDFVGDAQAENYALAWAFDTNPREVFGFVAEPAGLAGLGLLVLVCRRKARRR